MKKARTVARKKRAGGPTVTESNVVDVNTTSGEQRRIKTKRRSRVWEHFTFSPEDSVAVCNHEGCGHRYLHTGGSGTRYSKQGVWKEDRDERRGRECRREERGRERERGGGNKDSRG
jgi:hypothetical protein